VTSRQQALAIGIAQARRAGYKVPAVPQTGHARKKQLDRDIATALAQPPPSSLQLKDRYSGSPIFLTVRGDHVVGAMGTEPKRYMGMSLDEAKHYARHGGRTRGDHAAIKLDKDDARMFGRQAQRLRQTRAQTLANARAEGFAAHQLGAVEEGWESERSDTQQGGFPSGDSAHATRRKARAQRVTAYHINFTPEERRALVFASGRYSWPDMLSAHLDENGSVAFTESEMWQWVEDVDRDAEGGHSHFPLASGAFAEKLQRFYDARV